MLASPAKLFRFGVIASTVVLVWIASLYLADYVTESDIARSIVANFGYFGILVIAVISGINVLIPVPAATFVPIFTAAGLWLPFIIILLVVGTTIADLLGYFVGRWSRDFTATHYPNTYERVLTINNHHHVWLLPAIFLYAALIPLPNEAVIIPVALVGVRFKTILLPLMVGTLINQTALALGANNIFLFLFS